MKILLVCTVGGHLAQLDELQRRFVVPGDEVVWVTHDTAQSASLLAGRRVHWVPYIEERDVRGVVRTIPTAWRLLRSERPDLVVSTGSAIALSFLPLARVLGAHVAFVESAAMRQGHTRTGRALQYVPGIQLLTQSPTTATGRWAYIGSVFDGFAARRDASAAAPRHVVVTVGTSEEFGFRNLIERVLAILPEDVDVVWQTGVTDLTGLDIDATPWIPGSDLEAAIADADAVISHAGAGSALAALVQGRRPILVARRAASGEFNDDHQTEIADQLAADGVAFRAHLDTLAWDDVVEAARWSVERITGGEPLPIRPSTRRRRQRSAP